MPTAHRRIQLTLTPELDRVLSDVAGLSGKPQATIVREMLVEALPGLQLWIDAVRIAESRPKEAARKMLGVLDAVSVEVDQLRLPLKQRRRRRKVR